jgi:hypothetical protein
MRRLASAFALSACAAAALAQSTLPPNAAPAAEGARQSVPPSTPGTTPGSQPPQRGFIAPVVDIRIQGDGISLPKPAPAAPEAEKPPAPQTK